MDQRTLTTMVLAHEIRKVVSAILPDDPENPLARQIMDILPDLDGDHKELEERLPGMTDHELRDLLSRVGFSQIQIFCAMILADRKYIRDHEIAPPE